MKVPIIVLCATFLASIAMFTTLLAQDAPEVAPLLSSSIPTPHSTSEPEQPANTPVPETVIDYTQQLHNASTIMGHIGVGHIALTHEAYPEATANIKAALESIRDLIKETELFDSNEPIKLANLSYFSGKGEQNFWLPMLDNHFVVRTMDGGFLKSKKPDIQVMDAQIVYYRLSLNIRSILERLEDAELALKKKDYQDAEFALQSAIRGTFIDKFAHDNTTTRTLDHLMLSEQLIKDKNFKSAAAALSHVRQGLDQIIATIPKKTKRFDTARALLDDISNLQSRMNRSPDSASLKIKMSNFAKWSNQINTLAH